MIWRRLLGWGVLPLLLSGCLLSRGDGLPPRLLAPAELPTTPANPIAHAATVRLGVVDATAPIQVEVLHYDQTGDVRRDPQFRWSEPPADVWRRTLRGTAEAHGMMLGERPDIPGLQVTLVRYGLAAPMAPAGMGLMTLECEVRLVQVDGRLEVFTISRTAPFSGTLPGNLAQATAEVLAQAAAACWQEVRRRSAEPR